MMRIQQLDDGSVQLVIELNKGTSIVQNITDAQLDELARVHQNRKGFLTAKKYAQKYIDTLEIPDNVKDLAGVDNLDPDLIHRIVEACKIRSADGIDQAWKTAAKTVLRKYLMGRWIGEIEENMIHAKLYIGMVLYALANVHFYNDEIQRAEEPDHFANCLRTAAEDNTLSILQLKDVMVNIVWG